MAKSSQRYAICVDNTDYPAALELRKIYRVIPDADAAQDGDLRVIDESGEDYLYPADYFVSSGKKYCSSSSFAMRSRLSLRSRARAKRRAKTM